MRLKLNNAYQKKYIVWHTLYEEYDLTTRGWTEGSRVYTAQEVLMAAILGELWPFNLGFVGYE